MRYFKTKKGSLYEHRCVRGSFLDKTVHPFFAKLLIDISLSLVSFTEKEKYQITSEDACFIFQMMRNSDLNLVHLKHGPRQPIIML